jgi:hypothetical protein
MATLHGFEHEEDLLEKSDCSSSGVQLVIYWFLLRGWKQGWGEFGTWVSVLAADATSTRIPGPDPAPPARWVCRKFSVSARQFLDIYQFCSYLLFHAPPRLGVIYFK